MHLTRSQILMNITEEMEPEEIEIYFRTCILNSLHITCNVLFITVPNVLYLYIL